MKKMLKVLCCITLALIMAVAGITASAESFQEKNGQGKTVLVQQKDVFVSNRYLQGQDFGIGEFNAINDICVCGNYIYLLDSGNSRVVVLDNNYQFVRVIDSIKNGEEALDLSSANGLYVTNSGAIYIADSTKQYVVVANADGIVKKIITKPDSPIIPDNLEFKAIKVVEDKDGFIFVLCKGVYYGALVFTQDYEFSGFFGANQTSATVFDAIKNFFVNTLKSEAQYEFSLRELPYEFDDIYEKGGFIYTATANSESGKGQIRKLSYSGINILNRDGDSADNFAFGNGETIQLIDRTTAIEHFSAVAVDDKGYIYALDSTYGRVFVYDTGCNLVTAFGGGKGLGEQVGTFKNATELAINGKDILVVDSHTNSLTVFTLTDFGKLLFSAMEKTNNGDFEGAYPLWLNVKEQDGYNQLAYVGIANYYISIEDYKSALEYAKLGYERDIYERAFEQVRLNLLSENFAIIFIVAIIAIIGIIVYLVWRKKHPREKREPGIVLTSLLAPLRPIQTSLKIKTLRKQKSKQLNIYMFIAFGIMFLMFIGKVLETTWGGFMYSDYDPDKYNSAMVLITTVGIAVLWCVVNWGLCTLFEGKGTFKEIVIATGFALIPQIIYSIFFIIASQFLVYSEQVILTGAQSICWIITIVVLLVELTIIHDYSFFRAIGMGIVTILGMVLCAFLILLVLTLFQDVLEFIRSVYNEVVFRNN